MISIALTEREAAWLFDSLDMTVDAAIDTKRDLEDADLEEQDGYIARLRDLQGRIADACKWDASGGLCTLPPSSAWDNDS